MDVEDEEPKRFSYSSVGVQYGKLMLLFRPDALGSNISYAVQEDQLFPALNAVPSDAPLSFLARHSIKTEYDAKIGAVQKSIAAQIGKPDVKLVPNFEEAFATLKAAAAVKGSEVRDDWEKQLGYLVEQYFEGLDWQLKNIKVGSDDLVQEGFNEAVDKGEVVFRLVEKLKFGSYGEVVIEDGVLFLQVSFSGSIFLPLKVADDTSPSRPCRPDLVPTCHTRPRNSWISCDGIPAVCIGTPNVLVSFGSWPAMEAAYVQFNSTSSAHSPWSLYATAFGFANVTSSAKFGDSQRRRNKRKYLKTSKTSS